MISLYELRYSDESERERKRKREREKMAIFHIFYDTSEADWEKGFTLLVNINFARS